MHHFPAAPRARLLCRTDLSRCGWLNIDFLDLDRNAIPFHLSLRRDEGLAVVNRRHDGTWRREIAWPVALAGRDAQIEIAFDRGRAALWIDGRLLGRFDRFPRPSAGGRFLLRRGFPGMARIDHVRLDGGLAEGSLRLICPGPAQDAPGARLTPQLEVEFDLPAAAPPGPLRILLGTDDLVAPHRVAVIERVHADADGRPMRAVRAVLPGRVWIGAGEAVELTVRLPGGGHLGPLRLDRAQMAAGIDRALRGGARGATLLTALEHLRHGALDRHLPDATRAELRAAAASGGLADWMPTAAQAEPLPRQPPAPDPVERAWPAAVAALRQGDLSGLATALSDPGLDREGHQTLLRRLVEPACAEGTMPDLARLAQDLGLLPLTEGDSVWEQTTALPFDLAQGWFQSVEDRLTWLASLRDGWPVTPAIAWTLRQIVDLTPALDGTRPDPAAQDRIVLAWLGWLDRLADDYAGRGPCVALIETMAHILAHPERLPHRLVGSCGWSALRLWGLSPRFHAALRARVPPAPNPAVPPDLPGALAEAAAMCAELETELEQAQPDPARLDALLTRALTLGIADAQRFRRELLGPSGVVQGLDIPALRMAWIDPDEASLRSLLHPDGTGLLDQAPPAVQPRILDAAGRGLIAAWAEVPPARLPALERRAMAGARALLAAPDPELLKSWPAQLAPLSVPAQGQAGLALALGLMAGLVRQGRQAEARQLLEHLPPVAGLSPQAGVAAGPELALAVLARADAVVATQAATVLGLDPPAPAAAVSAVPDGHPLHDALVAVYSCRPNLDSRVVALRRTWLRDLTAMGIPWLVFTGDGDGTRQGDVVHLEAPDDYEGLPDKTLALVRWVLANTTVSRLVKVDDDCFLHAAAWFGDLGHLRHDYWGRALRLEPGQMNRAWHMARSRTPRGRLELDKSPEPSRYADGGSGYMLSRRAMAALVAQADRPEGRLLRQVSFMEDKLVGDLLVRAGITVSGEGYHAAVWRRAGAGGPLVPAWENGPLPWRGSPVRLAHLDGSDHQVLAQERSRRPVPATGKIWPGFQPARLGTQSNALDLICPPERLQRARAAPVAVVACLRNEAAILPAWLAHYRRMGVGAFLIADNGSDDGTLALLADQPDVALFSVGTDYARSMFGVAWQQALLSNFRMGRWTLVADADEFLVWSDNPDASLPALLSRPELAGADAVRVLMLDLYPAGPLSAVTLASGDPIAETGHCDRAPFLRTSAGRGPFSDAETLTSALRHRLIPGSRPELFVAQKYALLRYRPWMRLSAGLHFVAETRPADRDLLFAHIKYTAAFHARAQAEVARRQHFNDAEEYRKYLALMAEGRDTLFDPDLSVPWRDCPEVRRILADWA